MRTFPSTDVIGVYINEKNITVGDKNTVVRFDLSDTIQVIEDAKLRM